jgi:hypothetical protein
MLGRLSYRISPNRGTHETVLFDRFRGGKRELPASVYGSHSNGLWGPLPAVSAEFESHRQYWEAVAAR